MGNRFSNLEVEEFAKTENISISSALNTVLWVWSGRELNMLSVAEPISVDQAFQELDKMKLKWTKDQKILFKEVESLIRATLEKLRNVKTEEQAEVVLQEVQKLDDRVNKARAKHRDSLKKRR